MLYVIGAVASAMINDESLTPDHVAQVLVPKLLRDWWQAHPTTVVLATLPVALVLVGGCIWGEIAHKTRKREELVLKLRGELAAERRHQRTVGQARDEARGVAEQAAREEMQRHAGRGELPASAEPQGQPFEEATLNPPPRFVGRADDLA
jgi:hypothetical protein